MRAAAAAPLGYDSNFGPASCRDNTVHGACRPGGAGADDVPVPDGSISDAAVAAWAAHVAAAGVTRVVSLLDASELKAYATPLSEQYGRLFKRCAHMRNIESRLRADRLPVLRRRHDMVQMSHDPEESRAAHARIMEAFSEAHAAGERVVVHCRGGQSRTGLALASWLVQQHGCSAEAAAAEVERSAAAQKLIRFAKAAKVSAFTGRA